MSKSSKEAKLAAEEVVVEEAAPAETPAVEEAVATDGRDAGFYKRHPGALPGVIYE